MNKWIKRILWMSASIMICMPNMKTYAIEKDELTGYYREDKESDFDSILIIDEVNTNNKERLFITKYIVITTKEPMRSGPGANYSVIGYLYKDDIVNVSTIENGWVKFKVNGEWRYIKESSIKKC